jgi:hypothetical protein
MKTVSDAGSWYEETKRSLARMRRLGQKHWTDPSLEPASIWHDDEFRMLEAPDIVEETTVSLRPIDDLATAGHFLVFYRNWAAHGWRDWSTNINRVTPQMAYERLKESWASLEIAAEAESVERRPSPGEVE